MTDYTKPLIDPKDPIHPNQWKKYGYHLPSSIEGKVNVFVEVPFRSDSPKEKIQEIVDDIYLFRRASGYILDIKQCKFLVFRDDDSVLELETPPVIHNRAYLMGWLEGRYIG